MVKIIRLLKIILIVFIGLTIYLAIRFVNLSNNLRSDPLNLPISLPSSGQVEEVDTIIHVPMQALYQVSLHFSNPNQIKSGDFEKKVTLIPLQWKIESTPMGGSGESIFIDNPMISKETTTVCSWETGRDYFSQDIDSSTIFLVPGDYRFTAHVLNNTAEATNIPVRIQIAIESGYAGRNYFGADMAYSVSICFLILVDFILIVAIMGLVFFRKTTHKD
jgi:hypothetical protein